MGTGQQGLQSNCLAHKHHLPAHQPLTLPTQPKDLQGPPYSQTPVPTSQCPAHKPHPQCPMLTCSASSLQPYVPPSDAQG